MHKQTEKARKEKKKNKLRWKSTLFLFHPTSDFSYTSAAEPISSVSSPLLSEWGKDIKVIGNKFKCIKEISQVYNCKEGFVHDKYFNIMNFLSYVPFQTSADKKCI